MYPQQQFAPQYAPQQMWQQPAVRSMQPYYGEVPLSSKPDYEAYANYLESQGWTREQITIDELNTNLVTLFGLAAGATGRIIEIRAPAGQKISIMGTQQIPRGADARSAHTLSVRLANSLDAEIPVDTKVRIFKEKTSEAVIQLVRTFYRHVSLTKQNGTATVARLDKTDLEWYRHKQGVELNGEQRYVIQIANTEPTAVAIDPNRTKFALDADLWTYEV